ncbi:hypothetical protein AVEN_161126-1 [Araneus ventricosus]|uniref:Uncharacterized protein n=1 Tax=Araneus ventricosus TaxID=182803 RepID=A0A4Y2K354_ARAVE|nr:hypothetical protein AVEN_161126-1 [Araneus ventricosus]
MLLAGFRFNGPKKEFHPGIKPNLGIIPKPGSKYNHTSEYVPQYVEIPQYIPTSGSIFARVPSVILYTNTLIEAIYSTDILHELFDLSQTTPKQYADFFRIYGRNYLLSLCIENADELVEFAFRGVEPYFDVLTLPIVARFYANSAANFLFSDGFLQMHNAEDLALAYARAMAHCARVSLNSDPTSKFQVLADGFVSYFESLGLSTKEKVPFLAYYVGNEWFVAAVNYRCV